MKFSGLLIKAGIAASALFACIHASLPARAQATTCPNGTSITDKVVQLNPPFDANDYGNCSGKHSSCDQPPSGTTSSIYAAKIAAAFNIAPLFFQTALCNLDKIYIVEDSNLQKKNPVAWGMRQRLANSVQHIAISALAWTTLTSNSYSAYENYVLNRLLVYPWQPQQATPLYTASPDTEELMTLGILAHEMGHIVWWDRSIFAHQCPINNAFQSYYDFSWSNPNFPHGFHQFGEEEGTHSSLSDDFTKDKIVAFLKARLYDKAGTDLQTVYNEGSWPSLFGYIAPDEDFVETYKLWVLMNSTEPFLTLKIQIPLPSPSITVDILHNYNDQSTVLGQKKIWINELLSPSSSAQCT